MKKILSLAALSALSTSVFAQLSTLPPPSLSEGIPVQSIGVNAGATHWDNPATLGAYRYASDNGTDVRYTPGTVDSHGTLFTTSTPAAVSGYISSINSAGGFIRGIFTGETAGWLNDFGYTHSGNPAGPGSFTVFTNIQALPPSPTVTFGQFVDIPLSIGTASSFDFWLNGVGAFGTTTPTPTDLGGVYTVFNQSNSTPATGAQVLWSQNPLLVNTWVPSMGAFVDVATYIVTLEDWRVDRGADKDYSDFTFAVQFYNAAGNPFAPVPEPSTYGLMGAAAMLGLVAFRKYNRGVGKA